MALAQYATKIIEYFSRKFVLSAASLVSGFWLVLEGKDVMEYATLVGVVLAFYNGANVVETVATIRANRSLNVKTAPSDKPTVEVNVEN